MCRVHIYTYIITTTSYIQIISFIFTKITIVIIIVVDVVDIVDVDIVVDDIGKHFNIFTYKTKEKCEKIKHRNKHTY